ncbi:glycosyltransferase [Carboxylicivirga linearis]|uniref:Glycosyltransferase n=1 Tax=Carboxylicivirga linearis TaxID=1628157 RepID=A0ABS5JX93_9BACT|nr:glycosyltransferase [Carboxylicivirga linearis]MBS2099531.1 glycosyltransferase [Carboxylicivirga linearis]
MLIIFLIFTGLIFFLYLLQTEKWRRVWKKEPVFITENLDQPPFISVVVAYKDEQDNLPNLLSSLSQQIFTNWELILVDDYSEDEGLNVCKELVNRFPFSIRCLSNSSGQGKKQALQVGAQMAKGELLVTTDADCSFESNWLQTIASFYKKHNSDLIIAPVRLKNDSGLLSAFQAYEFTALQITGGAAALNHSPIMLNGANLGCKRDLYLNADLMNTIASGDDMFLLEWAKKQGKKVHYLKSPKSMVYTPSESTYSEVLRQKSRWALKAKYYSDKKILVTGALVSLLTLMQLVLLVTAFFNPFSAFVFVLLLVSKSVIDFRLLREGSYLFGLMPCLRLLLFFQLLYPFYVLSVFVYPLFVPLTWKGRKI